MITSLRLVFIGSAAYAFFFGPEAGRDTTLLYLLVLIQALKLE